MTIEFMMVLSVLVMIVFTGMKFVETVYIDKEQRALKLYIRDAFYVFLSSLAVLYCTCMGLMRNPLLISFSL